MSDIINQELIFPIAFLQYFLVTAIKYKNDAFAIKTHNDNKGEGGTPTFETLASLCIEMFPKVLIGCRICLKYKKNNKIKNEQINNEIKKEMTKSGHDLEDLYNNDLDLCSKLKITNFSTIKNRFTLRYIIDLENSTKVYVTNFESMRYGAFANNQNYFWNINDEKTLVNFLNILENHVKEEFDKTIITLKTKK